MHRFLVGLRKFCESPYTKLAVGVVLLGSGTAEAYRSIEADLKAWSLGAHHGLMLFGLFNMLASIPDILEGTTTTIAHWER